MKHKKKIVIIVCLMIALICTFCTNPRVRVKTFVNLNSQKIEDALNAGHGIPGRLGDLTFNTWEGTSGHSMLEFVLMSPGNSYYGCYYSPDDVPLAFQNVNVKLTQDGHDYWTWEDEGDNHGATSKIKDNWYYFESFF